MVDTGTNAVVAHVRLGGLSAWKLALTPDGRLTYVTLPDNGRFGYIDTATNAATVSDVRLGSPLGIVIRPAPPAGD